MSFDVSNSIRVVVLCLNPFRAGRCLSTRKLVENYGLEVVSIPFEQGNVFRPIKLQ